MAPPSNQTLLSPAELSYLHTSLSLTPPVRPDGRAPTQFQPLLAENDILPGTNGSARFCFADGTEAIVGVKAEVEKTVSKGQTASLIEETEPEDVDMGESGKRTLGRTGKGDNSWVDMTIEIPGFRDDDALPTFLSAMLNEALVATRELTDKLWINNRFHWRLYIDVLLLSPPLSYPIPLLSLTTHLALLSTKLPALISEGDEDPLFDDDWDAALPLYPSKDLSCPPITLLVVAVGTNVIFDPSKEELAVADAVLAVSLSASTEDGDKGSMQLVSVRTIDPPSRTTTPGIADSMNSATGAISEAVKIQAVKKGASAEQGVWIPPRGGMPRSLVSKVVSMCLAKGGVGEEVMAGLRGINAGGP